MGRGFTEYRHAITNRREIVLYSAFFSYRLPEDRQLSVLQCPAWCPTCDGFIVAEDIPGIESMAEEIRRLQARDEESIRLWQFISGGKAVEERLVELELRIAWRKTRVNSARCLECGGFGIVVIPESGDFRHPATGEPVICENQGWADTTACIAEFSSEGECLTRRYG